MGCDIHIAIEAQDTDGAWREIEYQLDLRWWKDTPPVDGYPVAPDVFRSRNYDLFAVLANVRNGRAFAGCLTGSGWPSIAPDRGLPGGFDIEQVAPDHGEEAAWPDEEHGPRYLGDHSFRWVTLGELEAFDWDGVTSKQFGVVTAEEYERLRPGVAPEEYCGDITGDGIAVYEPGAYTEAKRAGRLAPRAHIRVTWGETAREATNDWAGAVLPWLRDLAASRPLRLVIGFDS